jgi:hypothetical protein
LNLNEVAFPPQVFEDGLPGQTRQWQADASRVVANTDTASGFITNYAADVSSPRFLLRLQFAPRHRGFSEKPRCAGPDVLK